MVACLIFDLDDTLCDYRQAMENAKKRASSVLQETGIDPTLFWKWYHQLEPILFKQFTEKKLTVDEYRFRRYADVLQKMGESKLELPDQLNTVYMNEANHNIQLFNDVIPFFQKMKEQGVGGAVLTNGPSDGQRDKIKALGISDYINKIFISSEIGSAKPKKEAFQYVLDNLQLSAFNVMMIGDSLEYDVEGANYAGIKGVLLDRANKYTNYHAPKISSLLDLLDQEGRIACL